MSESFGSPNPNSSQKTAYSLIYINEFIEAQMRGSPTHQWGKAVPKQIQINEDNRGAVMKMNNHFKQEQVSQQA